MGLGAVGAVGLAMWYAAPPVLAEWLTIQHDLREASAVVVLNGEFPARAEAAAGLYRQGWAREVWLTQDPRSGSPMDAGTRSNAWMLRALGVPREAVHILPGTATGTRAELRLVREEARRRGLEDTIIVVTSRLHTRRVLETWRAHPSPSPPLLLRYPPATAYEGRATIWREVLGAGAARLGLAR